MGTKEIKLRLLIEAVNTAGNQLQQVSNKLQGVAAQARKVSTASNKMASRGTSALRRMGVAADKLKTKMQGVKRAGDAMMSAGMQMGMAGAGLLGAAALPVTTAAKFEKGMAAVRAVTQGTEKDFESLEAAAKKLGRETKFTASEAAEGIKFLGMSGMDANEALTAIAPSLQLAAAGGLELAEAADIVTNVMAGMDLPISKVADTVDKLAYTAANSNQSVHELGEAFSYVAPYAADAGMSVSETAAMIGQLANAGVKATRGGTALRGILVSLAKPSKEAYTAFDRLGVSIAKNEDGTINYAKTLVDLKEAGAESADWIAIFRRNFGGFASMLAKKMPNVRELQEGIEGSGGAAKKMAEIMENNLGGAFTRFTSAASGLAVAIGEPLLKPLKKLLEYIAKLLNKMTEWAEKHPELATKIVVVVGGLGALLTVIGGILIPLGLFVKLLGVSVGALAGFGGGLVKVIGVAKGFGSLLAFSLSAGLKSALGVLGVGIASYQITKLFEPWLSKIELAFTNLNLGEAIQVAIGKADSLLSRFWAKLTGGDAKRAATADATVKSIREEADARAEAARRAENTAEVFYKIGESVEKVAQIDPFERVGELPPAVKKYGEYLQTMANLKEVKAKLSFSVEGEEKLVKTKETLDETKSKDVEVDTKVKGIAPLKKMQALLEVVPVKKMVDVIARVSGLSLVEQLRAAIDALEDKVVKITTRYVTEGQPPAAAAGGLFAAGGPVFRRLPEPYVRSGSGNRDDVPALLTKGEFVHPSAAVSKYGRRFMELVRTGLFPPSLAKAFAGGGAVSSLSSYLSNQTTNVTNAAPALQTFATGGPVASGSGIEYLGQLDLRIGKRTIPVRATRSVAEELKTIIRREAMIRSN